MVIKWFKRKSAKELEAAKKAPPEAETAAVAPEHEERPRSTSSGAFASESPAPSTESTDIPSSLFDEDESVIAGAASDSFPDSFDDLVTTAEPGEEERSFEEVQAEIEAEVAAAGERQAAADAAQAAWDSAEAEAEGMFARLREGLSRTQDAFVGQLKSVLRMKDRVDDELLDDVEDILIQADVGARSADMIRERLAKLGREQEAYDPDALAALVQDSIEEILEQGQRPLRKPAGGPMIYLVVGVNGTGKTTSIGKLALEFARKGKSVMLIAADTFRAAAVEQLGIWGERTGACLVASEREGADPASVCYEGLAEAVKSKPDVVLIDTAGRLHTKKYLMEELGKVIRVIRKTFPDAPHETILVIDATTGQNALNQVNTFREVAELSGLVMTKLDGTAKGGILVAIKQAHPDLPVFRIGIGEAPEDLREFDARQFSRALFDIGA